MKTLIETKGEYSLLAIDNECTPFVVAWKYDPKTQTWEQGHYFPFLWQAEEFFRARSQN